MSVEDMKIVGWIMAAGVFALMLGIAWLRWDNRRGTR